MEGLGLDLPTFIGQLISFILLFGLITLFGYKPIRQVLSERAKRIKEGLEHAEKMKKDYEHAQLDVEKRIGEAREQGEKLIEQARAIGEKIKEESREEARAEAQVIIEQTRREMQLTQDKMVENLRREFADLAVLAAEKVIHESLSGEQHRHLLEETLKESALLKKH